MKFNVFYIVKDSQTGFDLSRHSSFEDAQKTVSELEKKDIEDGNFCPDYYEIIDDFELIKEN